MEYGYEHLRHRPECARTDKPRSASGSNTGTANPDAESLRVRFHPQESNGAATGAGAHAGRLLNQNGTARGRYQTDVKKAAEQPEVERKRARQALRIRANDESTPLGRAAAKHLAGSPARQVSLASKNDAQLAESASRSNAGVDSFGRAARFAGRGLIGVSTVSAIYDVAHAPADERPRVAAEAGTGMLGGLGAGAACEAGFVAAGLPEAGVGAIATGAVGTVACSAAGGMLTTDIVHNVLTGNPEAVPHPRPGSTPRPI